MALLGAIEAGGTKFGCGGRTGEIDVVVARESFPTLTVRERLHR